MSEISGLREFGTFRLDAEKRVLWHSGKPVDLALKEIEILCALTERGGDVVTKDELLDRVWHDSFVDESSLSRHIYVLRKALRDHGESDELIKTIPRRGYRFAGDIREIPNAAIAVEKHTQTRTLIEIEEQKKNSFLSRIAVPAFASVVIAALIGVVAFTGFQSSSSESNAPKIRSIAVLPFNSIGAEDNRQGLGLADVLITRLANVKELTIRPTSAVMNLAGQDSALLGKQLNVDAVLEGTIQRANDRIRVTARLVNTSNNASIWAGQFEKPAKDEFRFQDEIAAQVVNALAVRLTGDEQTALAKTYTKNPDAYRLYLDARHEWNKRSWEGMVNAQRLFRNAIAADPNFALAYVGLADTIGTGENDTEAFAAAEKALELDPDLAEAHATMGFLLMFHNWDWAGAERSLKRSIELNPGYATAHQWYATLLAIKGDTTAAKTEMQHAIEINPVSHNFLADMGQIYYFNREYNAAENYCLRALEISPDFVFARQYLSASYLRQGKHDMAVNEELAARRINETHPNASAAGKKRLDESLEKLSAAYKKGGIREYLIVRSREQPDGQFANYLKAVNHSFLGERELALDELEKAIENKVFLAAFVKADPVFDDLRSEKRYQQLIAKMGL